MERCQTCVMLIDNGELKAKENECVGHECCSDVNCKLEHEDWDISTSPQDDWR